MIYVLWYFLAHPVKVQKDTDEFDNICYEQIYE